MLVAIVLVLILSLFIIKKSLKKNALAVFPEPPAQFFLGHILNLSSPTEIISLTSKYVSVYGKIVRQRFGPSNWPIKQALFTTDYNFIESVLTSNNILKKSENYKFLTPWLGNGLLVSDGMSIKGDYWRRHRKILTPAFHFEILKEFVEVFERTGNVFIEKLAQYDGSSDVDLHPLATLYTLDVICETAMGTKLNVQSGENLQYVQSVKNMCRIMTDRCYTPTAVYDVTFWLSKMYSVQKTALSILHNFTRNVIDARKRRVTQNSTKKMVFLDLLLKFARDGNGFTENEIREEVDTFMFEGHDTTAAGISFILYCLANNPNVQEKVLQEQKSLFGNEINPEVTHSSLQEMKYLEYVIKESFRLFPPVPVIGRYTTEDIKLGGYVIPKDVNIVMFLYGLHRDPDYFPEPENFKPERFETFDGSLPYAYIPFSAGPRNCIGQKFAMLELKSIVSKIIRHFEIGPSVPRHELQLSVEAVLKSVNGVKVSLKLRK